MIVRVNTPQSMAVRFRLFVNPVECVGLYLILLKYLTVDNFESLSSLIVHYFCNLWIIGS